MDFLTNRLERLRQLKLDQGIGANGNEFDILKNEIRFDLLVCGGSLDVIVSVLYWLMASNTLPPLTVIFSGLILLTFYNFQFPEHEDTRLTRRIRDALHLYLQLLVWPKLFFHWYFSIRGEHSSFFYIVSGGFFVWLYQVGNSISGAMAIYLVLITYFTFPMIGITVCFDWMLPLDSKDTSTPTVESLLPDPTEENEKLWELSLADEVEEKQILEKFQPSLSGLQVGPFPGSRADEDESLGQLLDLQLDPAAIPDVNDSDSSHSSFDAHNMTFSVHHFSSSSSDDTTDNITSKLEDASREMVNIPTNRNLNPSTKSTQRGARDSEDEEGFDVESFEVISKEEFNL